MKLYEDYGFLNIENIADHPSWLKVIIGGRQVGKTYGTLLYHLKKDIPHILLRRTTEELAMIGDSQNLNPYQAFYPLYKTALFKQGKYYVVQDYDEEGTPGKRRGIALSLPQIAHIRGFNGAAYKSIIFDEFIPEKGVRVLKTEGDSLLNAYTTINGNRELEGQPPCCLWLLANSNNINSYILEALNLTDDVIRMRQKGSEILDKGSVLIIQPKSEKILQERAKTALMQQVSSDEAFYKMAIGNEFSYDESPLIKTFSIKNMTPLFSYAGTLYAWEDDTRIYICRAPHNINPYKKGSWNAEQLQADYLWIKRFYAAGLVFFSDMRLLALFKNLFDVQF